MDRWTAIRNAAADVIADAQRVMGTAVFGPESGSYTLLSAIAERHLRLTVAEDRDLPPMVLGKLDQDEGTILLRPGLPLTRRNWLIAHEIGHHVLEHPPRQIEDLDEDLDEEASPSALTVRDGVYSAYNPRDRWEIEANVFAGELLAPVEEIRRQVLSDPEWTAPGIARYFGLSRLATLNRLAAALLPGPSRPAEGTTLAGSIRLDVQQFQAATEDPPRLIIAGPGAGKTRVLVSRFAFLVREKGTSPRRILALTYANKAAEEMRERLTELMPEHATSIYVTTFHALGLQLLMEFGANIGLSERPQLLTESDVFVFLRRRLGELPLGCFEDIYRPTENLKAILGAISRAKDEAADPAAVAALVSAWQERLSRDESVSVDREKEATRVAAAADFAAIYATYQSWLREHGYLDYGDLIMEALRLFSQADVADTVRARYDHILVDEVQDINYASGRLVHALDGLRGITWAVGDPRQSIYHFRGASSANLSGFHEDYPDAQTITLEWNYRSVKEIVDAGGRVPIPLPATDGILAPGMLKSNRGESRRPPATELIVAETGEDETAAICSFVRESLHQHPAEDVAVLCRRRTYAQAMSTALESAGIPTNWGGAIEERDTFKELMAVLLLAADDAMALPRLAMIEEHRLSPDDLACMLGSRPAHRSAQAVLFAASNGELSELSTEGREQARQLRKLAGVITHQPTAWHVIASYLFEESPWVRSLIADPSPESWRRLATLGQVADLAREFTQRERLAGGKNAAAFLAFLEDMREAGSIPASAIPSGPGMVNVLTVHASKGLEWPVVIVPHLVNGRFPSSDRAEIVPLPPGLIHSGDDSPEGAEEACLFYVAVTRARDRLVLSHARRYSSRATVPAPFLAPIEGLLAPRVDTSGAVPIPGASQPHPSPLVGGATPEQLTFRMLDTYGGCPQRYLYEHGYNLRGGESGSLRLHRLVHGVMQWSVDEAVRGSVPDSGAVAERMQEEWDAQELEGHAFAGSYRRWADQIVYPFARRLKPGTTVRLRQDVPLPLGSDVVRLTIDEIEDGDRPVWRKHRLGRPAKSYLTNDVPVAYVLAAEGTGAEVRVYHPRSGDDVPVQIQPKMRRLRTEKFLGHADGIRRGEFIPKPDPRACQVCPYFMICPGSELA